MQKNSSNNSGYQSRYWQMAGAAAMALTLGAISYRIYRRKFGVHPEVLKEAKGSITGPATAEIEESLEIVQYADLVKDETKIGWLKASLERQKGVIIRGLPRAESLT